MVNVKNKNAMAEVIHYLKGIKQEDIDKIPKKFIQYLNENASKEYTCGFDYNKPLKELKLLDETRGIIGMICYNYWCITEEQKQQYLSKLSYNEQEYQKKIYETYNHNNLFKKLGTKEAPNMATYKNNNNNSLIEPKYSFLKKVKKLICKIVNINN